MTFRESVKAIWKYNKLATIKWLIPIRYCDNQLFFMLPKWYNGQFSWVSINKYKN